jgi:hypothetical protein
MIDMLHTAFCAEFNIRSGRWAVETDRPVKGKRLHQFRSEERACAFVRHCEVALDIGATLRPIITENW